MMTEMSEYDSDVWFHKNVYRKICSIKKYHINVELSIILINRTVEYSLLSESV